MTTAKTSTARKGEFAPDIRYIWHDIDEDVRLVAMQKGLMIRKRIDSDHISSPSPRHYYQLIPVTLFPSPIDADCFAHAQAIQRPINRMMASIGRDHAFLESSLRPMLAVDDFTARMYDIYEREICRNGGAAAPYEMGIFRSDYIIDNVHRLRQVEVNAISVSFAGLAPAVSDFHRHTVRQYRHWTDRQIDARLPPNDSLRQVAGALCDAHTAYAKRFTDCAAILVVIENDPTNAMDQKMIEIEIKRQRTDVLIYRRTFDEMASTFAAIHLGPNRELRMRIGGGVDGDGDDRFVEISVVYLRTAYVPRDYHAPQAWQIRALLERSRAIKCPSIALQLAGVKAFQRILCDRETLKRYIVDCDDSTLDAVHETFAQFWPIGDETETIPMVERGGPRSYVLKPNLEGGGNNYFGDEIVPKLRQICGTDQASKYVLMQYIEQRADTNGRILHPDFDLRESTPKGINTELGIFGAILADTSSGCNNIVFNRVAGHLVRAKNAESNETGIISGGGALDSPYLLRRADDNDNE